MSKKLKNGDNKVAVQFRVGAGLLERIDAAVQQSNTSRNSWLTDAVDFLLTRGRPIRFRITATELLANKSTIVARLPPIAIEMIDEACDERGIPRTVWLLDACMTQLRRRGGGRY